MSDDVIARGRIKVDARKALDKLRDHMLVDPHLWACEIARVAVALGATRLDVDWDTDDLVFEFDGRALAPDQIAHARDHVLTPLDGPDGDALRALGIGIGAALSLDPAYVDVLSAGQRVRFERKYMQDALAPEPVAAETAPGITRVHFKRRLGLGLLTRWTEVPEEVSLLRDAFEAPGVTLRLRGTPAPRREEPVLTVDLDVPGATRAELEMLRRPMVARVDFLHYGVCISSLALTGLWGLTGRWHAELPVRVVVDATDLPTNASRSQVRNDAPLIDRALRHVEPAFAAGVAALRGDKSTLAVKIGHVVTTRAEPDVLVEVLGALAAAAALALRSNVPIDPSAERLLDDEVITDAIGRPVSLRSLRGGVDGQPIRVYEGDRPLTADLAPWLGGTIWKRGRQAERALEGLRLASVKELVEPALEAMQRRARALEHPASRPITSPANAAWKEHFTVESGRFAGLEGEIAMRSGHGVSLVRVFVDERLLETIPLPGARMPVEIALAWPGQLVATFAYDAVERSASLTLALHYALRVAAMGVGRNPGDPALVRQAIGAWADATRALGEGGVDSSRLGLLATIPAWRTNDGRLVPFAALEAYAKATGSICFASPSRAAPDGRVVLDARDLTPLRAALGDPNVGFVDYDRALGMDHDASESAPPLAVMIHRDGFDGFVAPSSDKMSRLRVYHAGTCLKRDVWRARNGPVEVVLIDRRAVPQPDLSALRFGSPLPELDVEEDALVEVVTEACESDAVDLAAFERYLEISQTMLRDRKNKALAKRIAALPARREQRRLDRLKASVEERAPIDVDAWLGGRLRGTFVAPGKGAATVALAPWGPSTILYRGHPLGTEMIGRLDVTAFVDVTDDAFVQEWTSLSEEGKTWAEEAIAAAALDLLEKLASSEGFADDELALRLLLVLLPASPMRAGAIVSRTAWPTVQGSAVAIGDATQVPAGVHRYAPWRSGSDPSPYDAPAVHLPLSKIGDARRKVFTAAGIQLVDVTEATTRLQALRAKSDGGAAPALGGSPVSPLLRRSLAELGATAIEGELELIDAPRCDVSRVRDGVREVVPIETGCPVRVIFRSEAEDEATVRREILEATKTLLRALVPHLEKVPPFVVRHVRALALANVMMTGRMEDADRDLPIFEATNGRFYRLSSLQGHASYTADPPPYPPIDDVVLRLDPNEASVLAKVFELRDDTEAMRVRARGLAARAAPPRTEIRVQEREQCMFFIDVDEEGVTGEIGLLKPSHVASRRIDVYTTMRPLTFLPDPEGWPVIAALNDDHLEVDDAFSALVDPKREMTRFHRLIRRIVGASVGRLLPAPPDTLGIVRLPVPLLLRSVRGKRAAAAMGVFWMPREWPERPSIHVEGIGVVDPDRVPLTEAGPAPSRVVPVGGKLWITAEASEVARAVEDVMAWVSVRLLTYVKTNPRTEKHRWDLALLGVLEDDAMDPAAELAKDRPDPNLVHVAARRAPHLIDRETGDSPTAPTHVQYAYIEADDVSAYVEEPAAAAPRVEAPAEGFLAGLVRRVTELVSSGPEVLEETPLTMALSQSIGALALTGRPVLYVQESKKGRPVTYLRDARKLVVNAAHPAVVAHTARPDGMLYLVLAALSEINRELVSVTDAEEVSTILDLLRANQA